MHKCAGVHDAMTNLTDVKNMTSEQHRDLSLSRSHRDINDLKKIQGWFKVHEPFDINQQTLRSFSSGLTASEDSGVNCEKNRSDRRKDPEKA